MVFPLAKFGCVLQEKLLKINFNIFFIFKKLYS